MSIQSVHNGAKDNVRQRYTDGVAAKKFRDTGVKKLFLLGLVPSAQEHYENVSKLWLLLKINQLNCTVATDLKLANILTGIMTHSSNHPCTYCNAVKGNLDQMGEYRTIGNCMINYEDWQKEGGKKNCAKIYENCINPPLFVGDEDDKIIDFVPPPELHLFIGIVNTVYDHMIVEFEDDAKKWAQMCHVQRVHVHVHMGVSLSAVTRVKLY